MTRIPWNKRSVEDIKKITESFGYKLLGEYSKDTKHKRVVIQDDDGYKYDVDLNHLIDGKTPYFVAKNNPFTLENISLWLKKENKTFTLCEDNIYKTAKEKLLFRCLDEFCGEIFDISWDEVYGQDCGCPFRFGNRVGKYNSLAYIKPDLIKEWDYEKNKKNPEEYAKSSHDKVSWICHNGHRWDAIISSRSRGNGCPKCADTRKESKIANELKKYLIYNFNAKDEYRILKNPETGYWLPYDIYIPYGDNPELNGFYIEVHGEQHYKICSWHKRQSDRNKTTPEEKFKYQKHLDKIKKSFARKNGTYIEINLRKIKTTEEAIEYIERIIEKTLSK